MFNMQTGYRFFYEGMHVAVLLNDSKIGENYRRDDRRITDKSKLAVQPARKDVNRTAVRYGRS